MASSKRCKPCPCGSGKKLGDCCQYANQSVIKHNDISDRILAACKAFEIKATYAKLWRRNQDKAEQYIQDECQKLLGRWNKFRDSIALAYAFDIYIASDNLQAAAELAGPVTTQLKDREFRQVIESCLKEKTPFIRGCLFDKKPSSVKARKALLTTLLKECPENAAFNYVYGMTSFYSDDSIALACHHVLFALHAMEQTHQDNAVMFARILLLTSLIFASEQVQNFEEAIQIFALFHEVSQALPEPDRMQLGYNENHFLPYMYQAIVQTRGIDKGIEYAEIMLAQTLNDEDLIGYAQACAIKSLALLHQNQLDEALVWIRRASAVYNDPRFTKQEADILYQKGMYPQAINLYRAVNILLLSGSNVFEAIDNEYRQACIIPQFELNVLAVNAHKRHIQAAIHLHDYAEAQAQIDIAQIHYPDKYDWSVFIDHMLDVEIAEDETSVARSKYDACCQEYAQFKTRVSKFAMYVQATQDRFASADLDNPENWDTFFNELQTVAEQMAEEACQNKERQLLYSAIREQHLAAYPQMEKLALDGLVTADFLYQAHIDEVSIDYAPIVVGFAKALEVVIKMSKGYSSTEKITLGQLICELENQVDPNILSRLHRINEFRRLAAHVTVLDKASASTVRDIIYGVQGRKQKGLLVIFLSNE